MYKMKKIILLIFASIYFACAGQHPTTNIEKSNTEFAYQVFVNYKENITNKIVFTIEDVDRVLSPFIAEVNSRNLLTYSNYFDFKNDYLYVYVEKKRVKVNRNGKIKYKKIR